MQVYHVGPPIFNKMQQAFRCGFRVKTLVIEQTGLNAVQAYFPVGIDFHGAFRIFFRRRAAPVSDQRFIAVLFRDLRQSAAYFSRAALSADGIH